MKKSRSMRLASALLVCTLLSTCMISGTFAKYTTQDSGSDVARVAKWGVELQVVGNLYGDSYGKANKIVKDNDESVTVQSVNIPNGSATVEDVVAPGTENTEGFSLSLKGRPEVDGEVTTTMVFQNIFLNAGAYGVMIEIPANVVTEAAFEEFKVAFYNEEQKAFEERTGLYYKNGDQYIFTTQKVENVDTYYTLEDALVLNNKYYPVDYTLGTSAGNVTTNDKTKDSLVNVAEAMASYLTLTNKEQSVDTTAFTYKGTRKFESNDTLDNWGMTNHKLTWKWAFEETDKAGDEATTSDKADTILGNLIAADPSSVKVVRFNGTGYETLSIIDGSENAETGLEAYKYVTTSANETVACLTTQFSIDITVTQVD